MALILCKECGREISDAATTCPHCGAPVKPSKPTKSNTASYIKIAILAACIFGVTGGICMYNMDFIWEQNLGVLSLILCAVSVLCAIVLSVKKRNE